MDLYIYIIVHKLVLELITYCCLPPPPACMLMIMLSMLSRLALLSPCLEFSCAVVNLFPCSRILRLPILGSVALFCWPRAPRFELRFAEETPVSDCNYDYNKTTTTTTTCFSINNYMQASCTSCFFCWCGIVGLPRTATTTCQKVFW